jgi:hypothetical protein
MSDVLTPWGYHVTDALPALISAEDFEAYMGGRIKASDERVSPMLSAVSSAARSYCRWHVSPTLSCVWTGSGSGRTIKLPALFVSSLTSVTETRNGVFSALVDGQFEWCEEGLIRRCQWIDWPHGWRSVVIEYEAGIDSDALSSIVAQIAANAIAAAPGIFEEHVGQVGVTYNQASSGVAGGITLMDRDKELLSPYRLPLGL